MEDVSDAVFRRLCRTVGADVCVTEFVNVETLLVGHPKAKRKIDLSGETGPTAIQIYGANPQNLEEAADIAAEANPAYLDINCGCWIPKIAARGAGAGWLKNPTAMVEMAGRIVKRMEGRLPVTVKTRLGIGTEDEMPIVELAKRLEGVGVRAMALHCRTAKQAYDGAADWSWATKVQKAVSIPVLVNGDLKTASDVKRALDETGCAGAMVGRASLLHPWIFREARALLDEGRVMEGPTVAERLAFLRLNLLANVEERGSPRGVMCLRRHLVGYLTGVPDGDALRMQMYRCDSLDGTLAILDAFETRLAETGDGFAPTLRAVGT